MDAEVGDQGGVALRNLLVEFMIPVFSFYLVLVRATQILVLLG